MSAIINNTFRKFNADNFITAVGTEKVYLMIGKNTAWSGASLGEYTEATPSDSAIPVPIDTAVSPYLHHNDMIAAKLITSTSVSHILKRVNWTTGTVYIEYDHLQDDIIDQDFFVFTDPAYRVYKCISNYGGAQSTVEPTGVSTSIIETSDNYRWKFMFEVAQADVLKFVTTDWIPVKSPATGGTDQANVETAAIAGALEHIDVTAGGGSYRSNVGTATAGTANTITLDSGASAVDDYYNNMSVFITSGTGSGQLRTISDYVGSTKVATVSVNWTTNPSSSSVNEVMPAVTIAAVSGEGTGATARVSSVVGGVIKKVAMVTVGGSNTAGSVGLATRYRSGTATISSGGGSAATLSVRVGPPGGHGDNAVSELGGAFVMLNSRLIGNDGSDFPVGDDFRKVHLLVNPLLTADSAVATATTYDATEIEDDSGQIIYTEFRAPINRASDSTEDIKLVMEF